MSITIGTVLSLLMVFAINIRHKRYKDKYLSLYGFMVLVKLFLNVGYFIKIGTYEILYDEFLTIIVFFYALYYIVRFKVNKHFWGMLIGLVVVICIPIIFNSLLYNEIGIPYGSSWDNYFYGKVGFELLKPTTTTVFMVARIIMFFVSMYVFIIFMNKKTLIRYLCLMYRVAFVAVVCAIAEYVLKNVVGSSLLNDFYINILGESASTKYGLGNIVNGTYAIVGWYREQSAFALEFSLIAIFLLFYYRLERKKRVLIVSILMEGMVLLSKAFTGLICAILYICFIVYVIFFNTHTGKKLSICFILIAVFICWYVTMGRNLFGDRIDNSLNIILHYDINKTYSVNSENIRLYSIIYNLALWLKHPLFGIGIGVSNSHGGVSSILVSIGAIGFCYWFFLVTYLFKRKNVKMKVVPIFSVLIMLLFIGSINFLYFECYVLLFLCAGMLLPYKRREKCNIQGIKLSNAFARNGGRL